MLEKLTKDDFAKCLHQKFLLHVAEQEPLETELIEVRGLVASDPNRRQPFSLIFQGPADVQLQQSTFMVENSTIGKLDLFLVTLGPNEDGMRHECVIS